MPEEAAKRLCVLSDHRSGSSALFQASAASLGRAMAEAGIGLIFGGSDTGLMGTLARTVKQHSGEVIAITLHNERDTSQFGDADQRIFVEDFQAWKRKAYDIADGIVVLPGGARVVDALMEHLTWMQRGRRSIPMYLVNAAGYWNHLIAMLTEMQEQDFVTSAITQRYIIVETSEEAVSQFVQRIDLAGSEHPFRGQ